MRRAGLKMQKGDQDWLWAVIPAARLKQIEDACPQGLISDEEYTRWRTNTLSWGIKGAKDWLWQAYSCTLS